MTEADLGPDGFDLALEEQGEIVVGRCLVDVAEEGLGGLSLDELRRGDVDDGFQDVGPAVDEAAVHDVTDLGGRALGHLVEAVEFVDIGVDIRVGTGFREQGFDDSERVLALEDDDRVALDPAGQLDADADLLRRVLEVAPDLLAAHEVELRHADFRLDAQHMGESARRQSGSLSSHPVERAECVDVEFHADWTSMPLTISTNSPKSGKA